MKRFISIGLLVCAAFALALLSPGLIHAQAAPQQVNITLSEFSFSPANITVAQGQPVHFVVKNTGKFPHSVSFSKGDKVLTVFAQPIQGGQSGEADFTFEEGGTWTMFCPVSNHAERGMVGEALVLTGGAPGMPTTGQAVSEALPVSILALTLVVGGLYLRRRWAAQRA